MKFLLSPILSLLAATNTPFNLPQIDAVFAGGGPAAASAASAVAKPAAKEAGQGAQIPQDDIVLRAMRDEMQRSMARLHLDKYKGPYFISYTIRQSDTLTTTASFGATDDLRSDTRRYMTVDVREGDYSLDSSQFEGGGGGFGFGQGRHFMSTEAVAVDDNYDALRHALWLKTDAMYKNAIENLESKKAFLQENSVKDRPDSMSREEPVVSVGPVDKLEVNPDKTAEMVASLSSIFKDYPKIEKSMVNLVESVDTRWFVNSEGFCHRGSHDTCTFSALASAQADDGMIVSDVEMVPVDREKSLPSQAELDKRVHGLVDRLIKMSQAKTADEYRGPILFEGQAAADFFAQSLMPFMGHASEPLNRKGIMSELMKNPLENKLGLRILPTFISAVDDPLTTKFGRTPITSSYQIDDDGVRAQKVTLVDKGVFKAFCMSRAPTKDVKRSNGHSKNGSGVSSNLYILSTQKLTPAQLKQKLIDLGKDDGLTYVLVARRLWNVGAGALEPGSLMASVMSSFASGSEVKLLPPVLLYKVSTADGHEEQLRGAQFSNLTMRVLRDIVATGADSAAYPVISLGNMLAARGSAEASTVVTPSILVQEVEVQKPSRQTALPPILKNPYFDRK